MWWDSIAEVLLWTSTHTKEWMLGHYVFQATVMPLGFIEAVLKWNPGFPGDSVGKEPACRAGDAGPWVWSLGQEDSLEESMATYSSILAWRIIPMDRGASWATVQEVTKSPTWLKRLSTHHALKLKHQWPEIVTISLKQSGRAWHFVSKGLNNKHCRLSGPHGSCCSHSLLQL